MDAHSIPRQRAVGVSAKILVCESMQTIAWGKNAYYGYIEEIWELNYGMTIQIHIFRCQWAKNPQGVEIVDYGFTVIDLTNVSHKYEPWVLGATVAQVFYILDPMDEKKYIVVPRKQ
jgi:aryl-phospho-beta-D-glucosidase BglC (GH1 family)